jgi:hypothetical protein
MYRLRIDVEILPARGSRSGIADGSAKPGTRSGSCQETPMYRRRLAQLIGGSS